MSRIVRVVDIGSNSIKSLVATSRGGLLLALMEGIRETRISAGISRQRPELRAEAMDAGLEAICALLTESEHLAAEQTRIVATSAVRDAANGAEFRDRVLQATGIGIDILSGNQEAAMIARGVATEPGISGPLTILDLGGGSLECIDADGGELRTVISLQLGAVRMMELFHRQCEHPLIGAERQRLIDHVTTTLTAGAGHLRNNRPACVGCGGAFAVIRAILGQRTDTPAIAESAVIAAETVEALLDEIASLPLDARLGIPGLPRSRADIFPAALAILVATGRFLGTQSFRHSLRNLRYGIADELLETFQ